MLENKIKQTLNDLENTDPNEIIDLLNQIKPLFKTTITQDYLQEKIKNILNTNSDSEKKLLCKNLKPYLDWYLQGTNK